MKDLDFWLKTLGIIGVFIIIAFVITGCQFLQKDRESASDCTLICDDCKGLQMECELNTTRQNRYTQGTQPDDIESDNGER
jgi:hypothetical protein